MAHEYWATFSIFDHRKPLFRQSLVLFDRIVVPIPTEPVGDQTDEELEKLRADVCWLEKQEAARLVEWDPEEFRTWRNSRSAESMSVVLNRDLQYATRLQVLRHQPAPLDMASHLQMESQLLENLTKRTIKFM